MSNTWDCSDEISPLEVSFGSSLIQLIITLNIQNEEVSGIIGYLNICTS